MKEFKEVWQDLLIVLGVCLVFAGYACVFTPYPVANVVHSIFLTSSPSRPPKQYRTIQKQVSVSKDQHYPSLLGNNQFDTYLPKKKGKFPVIVWLHGGAFVGGQKEDISVYATLLAHAGYAVVVPNYQLAPYAPYPSPLIQLGDVLKHIQHKGSQAAFDLEQLFLAGDSAGGQIVGQYVTSQLDSSYRKTLGLSKQLTPQQIKGVLYYCTPFDLLALTKKSPSYLVRFFTKRIGWAYAKDSHWAKSALVREADLLTHLSPKMPPVFITDGNNHSFASQGLRYQKAVEKQGGEVSAAFYSHPNVPLEHEYQFDFSLKEAQQTFAATLEFLDNQQVVE